MNKPDTPTNSLKPKLLDQVREKLCLYGYSIRTEKTYVLWVRRYIYFHKMRHSKEMGRESSEREIEVFLSHLVSDGNVAASTQNQALSALLFLYKHVLHIELGARINALQAKKPERLPTVLSREEVWQVINELSGVYRFFTHCACQKISQRT